jgi:1-deoxy-D-xylulose-5-phosphate synthase
VEFKFLDMIDVPADLRKLDVQDLRTVSAEVREYLIDVVSKTGGHFGAEIGRAHV